MLHFRLSSLFYTTQLIDIFSYELPLYKSYVINPETAGPKSALNSAISILTVYNFHSLFFQERFFVFLFNFSNKANFLIFKRTFVVSSLTELFYAGNWLEREVAELNGVNFFFKKDLRNLMLQYGDTSLPFQKSFPSIGVKEMFYDPIRDTLIQNPVTVQI
jgi:NADH:ubiquinone oxidoreductase subunit C